MNPPENKESITTYTLRLKDDLKARMERSAKKKGWSLNTLILDIIERHYQAAGFVEGNRLTSRTGRLYEIRVDASDSHPPDEPTCFFFIDDPKRDKEIAYYTIGLSRSLLRNLRVREEDQYAVIKEIGLALLSFYNASGKELSSLSWEQQPGYPNRRIIHLQEVPVEIESQEQFLILLREKAWTDKFLSFQSISTQNIWTAKGEPLGYWGGDDVFDRSGKHAGKIFQENNGQQRHVYSLQGEYLGDIYKNRLVINRHVNKQDRKLPVAQDKDRAPLTVEPIQPWTSYPESYLDTETSLEYPVYQ
jgi:hypothetical protein